MPPPLKPDEARRLAIDLALDAGLNRDHATALASSLLWFDTAGFPSMGLASLPEWLDRIARGEIDPKAQSSVGRERAGTAQLDGRNGLPQATLARAATIAGQKARELGLALARVRGIGAIRSAAPMAAELAIGPLAGLAMGPQGAWSLALPTAGGLPLVYDATFGESEEGPSLGLMAPWMPLLPEDGWLLMALNLPAFEPLASFQERTAEAAGRPGQGRVDPKAWEERRLALQEHGLELPEGLVRRFG
jgi:hypothetical protein